MDRAILADQVEYDASSPSGLRRKRNGSIAGSYSPSQKYWRVRVNGGRILCHNAIWILFNGSVPEGMQIDHIDGDKLNNRIENLRLASASGNAMNRGLRIDNKAGVKGLCWEPIRGRWCGQVNKNGKAYYKNSKDRAVVEAWLIETRNRLHGEFARHE